MDEKIRKQKKVSIIIPVYNRENTIERCLDSILTQTYKNLEVIIINDGSTDRSGEIINAYALKDSRILAITKENSGVSDSRNFGLKSAHGDYIQFADSDDWLPERATELLVEALEKNRSDMVIADYCRVRGRQLYQSGAIENAGTLTRAEFAQVMMEKASDFYYGVVWNKLYRRKIIKKYKLQFSEELQWCEDFLFNLEYLKYTAKVEVIKEPVYYYVKTKGSLVSTQTTPGNIIRTKLMLYDYYKKLYESLDLYEDNKLRIQMFLIQSARDKKQKVKKKDYPPRLKREQQPLTGKLTRKMADILRENKDVLPGWMGGATLDEKLEEAALTGIRQTKAVLALQAQDMNPQEIAETLRLPVETVCRILEEPAYTPEDRTEQD
ncbi:MAG TPA: glycosyltransferase [Candidatus Egerieimonas faecigallinarum]|nr:glycosyltransferase [Candidatus Egerieimonas faecigallinarum]